MIWYEQGKKKPPRLSYKLSYAQEMGCPQIQDTVSQVAECST